MGFQDIALGPGPERLEDVGHLFLKGQENRLGAWRDFADLPGGIYSVQEGHAKVEHGNVGAVFSGEPDSLATVRSFCHDTVPFARQELFHSLPDNQVVLSQENSERHRSPSPHKPCPVTRLPSRPLPANRFTPPQAWSSLRVLEATLEFEDRWNNQADHSISDGKKPET